MAIKEYPNFEIDHVDDGETKEQVIFNGKRVAAFIKAVAARRPIDGVIYKFDEHLINKLHDLVFMVPGVEGFIRQHSSTIVDGIPAASAHTLPEKFTLYGRWLGEQMEYMNQNPDDLVKVLEIAAGAHYGITMPETHFFDGGNGRTARALVNIILMAQTLELTAHGYAIPPIPILREAETSEKYVDALRSVGDTRSLTPLMVFFAKQWKNNLQERIEKIQERVPVPKSKADANLIKKLYWRREQLRKFISHGYEDLIQRPDSKDHKRTAPTPYPIPDYFRPRYVRFDSA
jgi:Fic family protein